MSQKTPVGRTDNCESSASSILATPGKFAASGHYLNMRILPIIDDNQAHGCFVDWTERPRRRSRQLVAS
jgi:hypothetical protein